MAPWFKKSIQLQTHPFWADTEYTNHAYQQSNFCKQKFTVSPKVPTDYADSQMYTGLVIYLLMQE